MLAAYRRMVVHPRLQVAAILMAVLCLIGTVMHYVGQFPGNPFTWAAWLLAVAAFAASFTTLRLRASRPTLVGLARSEAGIALGVLLLYLITHLWNFGVAPWNTNGLFDDAAWDIYFARDHAFNGPYQPAFFDDVGLISRETVFHYYITVFFKVFGYNLLVFNAALLVLGYVTVVCTTLIAHRLFRTPAITIAVALMLNFLPLHYVHVFVGHRYAIAAPLMMVSLYLLYSGFQDRSGLRLGLSASFAALCFGSAIMGKQFVLALAATGLVLPFMDRRRALNRENLALAGAWVLAFLIAAMPLFVYIAFNPTEYFRRESGLLGDFLSRLAGQGFDGVRPYVDEVAELFFSDDTFRRMWLHDYPLIPTAYWLLLIPGLVIALVRRRVELLLLALIPVGSAFLSGAFDFRVLLAAPVVVLLMAFTLDDIGLGREDAVAGPRRRLATASAVLVVALGVLPSTAYVWALSQNTHGLYLLSHRDVAVARLMQDVVAGSDRPTASMKADEFDRRVNDASRAHDTLACAERAYAIAHLYLQPFGDRQILAFCDGGNQALLGPKGLLAANVRAIEAYQPGARGLRLIWEESELADPVIERFAPFERFGVASRLAGEVDGVPFAIYVLTIPASNVADFRAAVVTQIGGG